MKKPILILIFLIAGIHFAFSQNLIPDNSPIIGTWYLASPKKKTAGPEFIPESYKGVTNFTILAGDAESEASGLRDKKTGLFSYTMKFIAEWDGTKLTGKVTGASWDETNLILKISVPFAYDSKKDLITVHINNAEYGDVNFIYKRNKY